MFKTTIHMKLKKIKKAIYPVKFFSFGERLIFQGINRVKKIFQRKFKFPSLEDALFVVLLLFSFSFGALLFGIGEEIKNEKSVAVNNYKLPSKLERDISKMVSGRPIQKMAPHIARQNKEVAAYLVAIARKESNWGKFSPKKDGRDCYNYWGYRGIYNQTESGYSCFDSPGQAVRVVGERIGELIAQNIDTSKEMVVWKCGRDCSSHNPASVRDWIHDVDLYYKKF